MTKPVEASQLTLEDRVVAAPRGVAARDRRHVTLSSVEMDYQTPTWFVALLVAAFDRIAFDPATSAGNPVGADAFFDGSSPQRCGLRNPWPEDGLSYVNPRYGRFLSGPVAPDGEVWKDGALVGVGTGWAARIAAHRGETAVLVPVRVETEWWATLCAWADWRLDWSSPVFGPRISFVDPSSKVTKKGSNIASAVFYRGPRPERFLDVFAPHGRPVPCERRLVAPGDWSAAELDALRRRFPIAEAERHAEALRDRDRDLDALRL